MGRPRGAVKPRTDTINFRLPADQVEFIKKLAAEEERTIAQTCRRMLRVGLLEKMKAAGIQQQQQ